MSRWRTLDLPPRSASARVALSFMPALRFFRRIKPGVILKNVFYNEGFQPGILLRSPMSVFLLFSVALAGCSGAPSNPALTAAINTPASLSGELPADPFQWQVITSFADKLHSTMSTLYGNDVAVQYARSNSGENYPAGSQLALITWKQREDPRWFGASVPDHLQSVEFVLVSQALIPVRSSPPQLIPSYSYQRFEGSPLQLASSWASTVRDSRSTFILSLPPSLLP